MPSAQSPPSPGQGRGQEVRHTVQGRPGVYSQVQENAAQVQGGHQEQLFRQLGGVKHWVLGCFSLPTEYPVKQM